MLDMMRDEIITRVHPNTLRYYELPESPVLRHVVPLELLDSRRLDVMARVLYARDYLKGIREGWGDFAYENLFKSWTNDFHPPREVEPGRFTMDDYHRQFQELIDSVAERGVSENITVIPTCNGTLIDGAHRLAAALALKVNSVPTVELVGEQQVQDYNTLLNIGMEADVVENLVLELIRLKGKSRVAVLFPCSTKTHEAAIQRLGQEYLIDYRAQVPVTYAGMERLMDVCYGSHEWWDQHHAREFSRRRLKGGLPLSIVFFQEASGRPTRPVKDAIRQLMGKGNDGIHTTDTHEETVAIADVLLNSHGRTWLNFSRRMDTPRFDLLFEEFRRRAADRDAQSDVCVDSGSVLAVHGLRDVNDLDYLQLGGGSLDRGGEINCHNGEYAGTGLDEAAIITDPRLHLHYRGVRFAALPVVTTLKKTRGSKKDLEDVLLIRSVRAYPIFTLYLRVRSLTSRLADFLMVAKSKAIVFSVDVIKAVLPRSLHPSARKLYFWWYRKRK